MQNANLRILPSISKLSMLKSKTQTTHYLLFVIVTRTNPAVDKSPKDFNIDQLCITAQKHAHFFRHSTKEDHGAGERSEPKDFSIHQLLPDRGEREFTGRTALPHPELLSLDLASVSVGVEKTNGTVRLNKRKSLGRLWCLWSSTSRASRSPPHTCRFFFSHQ